MNTHTGPTPPAHHPTLTENGRQNGSQGRLNASSPATTTVAPSAPDTSGADVHDPTTDPHTPTDAGRSDSRHPVGGAELLDRVHAALLRYVVLPSPAAMVGVVLWIAATHAQPAWAHAPRLVIRAPEKRCGKSRLLDVIEALCWNPFITVNSSPAAVYRSITTDPPTLLVDEADTIFGPKADGNEDLRGLLNAGHQRNRPAKRYDAASNRVESIPTFAMAALAGIGAMPDTIEDRAVIVRMRRRAPGETVAPFRHKRDRPALRRLAGELNGWLRDDLKELERAAPDMPVEDRAADTWEPLIAVADHAGQDWPDRARAAVLTLTGETADTGEDSERIRLLIDCHAAFGDETEIQSTVLLQRLKADPEAPWCDYGHTGLTPRKLAILLKEYDIKSVNIRFPGSGQLKGFYRAAFADAWRRYCPQLPTEPTPADDPADRPEATDTDPADHDGRGQPVPPVPPSFPQVSPVTSQNPGTSRLVPPPDPGTSRLVPPKRPVTGLTRQNEGGTGGTSHPPLRVIGGRR